MSRQTRAQAQQPLFCEGLISTWQVEVDARAYTNMDEERLGNLTLKIEGRFLAPLKGQELFYFTLYGRPDSFDLKGALGSVNKINPRVLGTMYLSISDLRILFTMACAGHLKSLLLDLGPPYRGRARIHSCFFFGGTMP